MPAAAAASALALSAAAAAASFAFSLAAAAASLAFWCRSRGVGLGLLVGGVGSNLAGLLYGIAGTCGDLVGCVFNGFLDLCTGLLGIGSGHGRSPSIGFGRPLRPSRSYALSIPDRTFFITGWDKTTECFFVSKSLETPLRPFGIDTSRRRPRPSQKGTLVL